MINIEAMFTELISCRLDKDWIAHHTVLLSYYDPLKSATEYEKLLEGMLLDEFTYALHFDPTISERVLVDYTYDVVSMDITSGMTTYNERVQN